MEINIWSDVRCPFCYIGKKKFETALEKFPHKDEVTVNWRSFELDPNLKTQPETSTIDYFVQTKGVDRNQAAQMLGHAKNMAKEVGLEFDFDSAVLANSFNAHRLIQMAKSKGLGDEIEEALFKAHFTDAKNIDDTDSLVEIGTSIGMEEKEVSAAMDSDAYADQVRQDQMEARNIGVQGVPFFVFNNKYAVSGAQAPEAFLQTIEKAYAEYKQANPGLIVEKGDSCSADGTCD